MAIPEGLGAPDEMIERLKKIRKLDRAKYYEWDEYILRLEPLRMSQGCFSQFKPGGDKVGYKLLELLVNIWALKVRVPDAKSARPEKRQQMLNHLEDLARRKFECSIKKPGQYVEKKLKKVPGDLEKDFDAYALERYSLLTDVSHGFKSFDSELVEWAKRFRLSYVDAESLNPSDFLPSIHSSRRYEVVQLMHHTFAALCKKIEHLKTVFDIYNVAELMDPGIEKDVSIRFKRLNEYNKICLAKGI